jgi:BlaI family penicillinase repressor
VAHSTVQTLLRQLETKGAVDHVTDERTFVFRAVLQPGDVASTPLRDVLERVYQGSVYNLLLHLVKDEKIAPEELARMRKLLDEEAEK